MYIKNKKVCFYVEFLEQIKSSSIGYNLETFGSRNTQRNLVPNLCNIQKLVKECFQKNRFKKGNGRSICNN